jgi:hypothetical protein
VTNTTYQLRRIVEHRQVEETFPEAAFPYTRRYGELIGECGHVVAITNGAEHHREQIGKRKRCPHCPIEE